MAVGEEVEYDLQERDGRFIAVNVTGPGGAKPRGAPQERRDSFDSGSMRGGDFGNRKPRDFGRGEDSE